MDKLSLSDIQPNCLKEYLSYLSTIKGRSINTVISYYNDMKLYLRFLKLQNDSSLRNVQFSEIRIDDIDEALIKNANLSTAMEFLFYMSAERRNSPKARSRRAVAIRRFYKYLTDVKLWYQVSPMEKLELPSPKVSLPKFLTVEQALDILNQYNDSSKNIADVRDYCILTFFLNCGMRLSELVGLNTNDFSITGDGESKTYTMKVLGKGNKERIIYMNAACVNAYDAYMKERNKLVEENKALHFEKALFISKRNKRISNRRVQQVVENALNACNLGNMGFSVHKLRHTAATLMYQNGVDVRVLKEVLGHENLDTTQIYTHVANEQLKKAIDQNPLAKVIKPDNKSNDK